MRVRDRYELVLQSLRESLVFFAANVVAISLGVFLLSVLLALSGGVERAIDRLMAEQVSPLLIEVRGGSGASGTALSPRAVSEIRAMPEVTRVDPVVMPILGELYRDASRHFYVSVMSTAGPNDPELSRVRWLGGSAALLARSDSAIVVPFDVARAVGFHDPKKLPGQRITLRFVRHRDGTDQVLDLPFIVAGVAAETRLSRCYATFPIMSRLAAWHSPLGVSWDQQERAATLDAAFVYARSVNDVARVREAIEKRGFRTTSILDSVAAYGRIMLVARIVLGLIAAIAFLAGSASIFNATYASVLRRNREFAVFKTYGASRADLYVIVLAENLFTAVVAALVGFAVAAAACVTLNRIALDKVGSDILPVEVNVFLIALGVAIATCILASIIPARLAARLSVVDAIASARDR